MFVDSKIELYHEWLLFFVFFFNLKDIDSLFRIMGKRNKIMSLSNISADLHTYLLEYLV